MDNNTVPIKLVCLLQGDLILLQVILINNEDIYELTMAIHEEGQKHGIFCSIVAKQLLSKVSIFWRSILTLQLVAFG